MKVSVSRVKAFKACRRMYELKYIENLEPVETAEALQIGKRYHKYLEEIANGADIIKGEEYANDFSRERAMAMAWRTHIACDQHLWIVEAEKHIEMDLGNGDILHGYVDAISRDKHIVEHKTTGSEITEQYEYNLQWDEQILAYMLLTGLRKVWYTICRKPTIRQKKDETDEHFFWRMVMWYDDDTDKKIRLLEITRTDAEVAEYENELLSTIKEMKNTGCFYRNTCHCNQYGRRCEYSGVCLHYDPDQQYVEYIKKEDD